MCALDKREIIGALLYHTRVASELPGRHGCFVTKVALELLPADTVLRPHIEAMLRRIAEHCAGPWYAARTPANSTPILMKKPLALSRCAWPRACGYWAR